jgi:exopolyphosphatase/guanosine-5'-triphosphate,3'-diphosphate pyrophosphatase
MTISVIDIGTNTVLLLVAEIDSSGDLHPLVYEQRLPRLGRGVDANRNLDPESMHRVIDVLREYKQLMAPHAPEVTVVCGTSAVRDAANRSEFAARVRNETGFALEILDGEQEALWAYRGGISGMRGIQRATVVDIGGGSTEISVGDTRKISDWVSLDIGSVRVTERFFRHDPPTHPELESTIELIENELARAARFPFKGSELVAVAGTATTLAALAQGLTRFDVAAVANYPMSVEKVEDLFRTLRAMPSGMIREKSSVMEGRADIITAGALILREIMRHFGFDRVIVSERGVRYGLAIRAAGGGV